MNEATLAPGADTLVAAVKAVTAVAHEGLSSDDALAHAEARKDRAAVRAITLGTLRWYLRLAPSVARLVNRPATDLAPPLRALLITAAHQIEYSRGAPEVSVHLAVDAARGLGLERATGFVNAVLRRFVRERIGLFAAVDADPVARSAHPDWFVRAVAQAWPVQHEELLAANNLHPPMVLRVDLSRGGSVASYLRELAAEGRAAQAIEWMPGAIELEHSASVNVLPGFREGRVSVQDTGAQLATHLLDLKPGQRVLDACAAPGGKTGHILEYESELKDVLAMDADERRLMMVSSTLTRLNREARVRRGDLTRSEALADEPLFDRILLDAPCSSTGVIRRHPDIKLLRREEDIAAMAGIQRYILERCFAHLAPRGRLVYATCSVLPEENETQIQSFLANNPEACLLPWPDHLVMPPGALQLKAGVQLLPGTIAGTDGFYYACLGLESSL